MIRTGLCSVTLRALAPADVVDVAARAGLQAIEWGGDIHVPAGDALRAREVAALTRDAGLAVASYGSYQRFTGSDAQCDALTGDVLTTAEALGATRVRVWAGRTGSAESDPSHRTELAARVRRAADSARAGGMELGLEFHRGTLTDGADATARFLEEVDRDNVRTYWQPPVGEDSDLATAGLLALLPWVSTVHAFSWWPEADRRPLGARADLWARVVDVLDDPRREHDVLLEFVEGDAPQQVIEDAAVLRQIVRARRIDPADAGRHGEDVG